MKQLTVALKDEQATVQLGNKLASTVGDGAIIYLHGDLGAGKTTFTRGCLLYTSPSPRDGLLSRMPSSA